MLQRLELVHFGRSCCVNTSARHDMQNIMHATLHKTRDIFTIFLTHNAEGYVMCPFFGKTPSWI